MIKDFFGRRVERRVEAEGGGRKGAGLRVAGVCVEREEKEGKKKEKACVVGSRRWGVNDVL